jgi:S1-C subfamily serine protease
VTASTAGGLREDQKLPPSSGGRAGGISGDLGGPRSGSGGIVTTPQREDGRGNPGRRGNPGGIRDIDNDRSTSSDSKGSNDPLSEANAPPLQLQATALFQNSITSNMKSILPAVVEMRPDGVIGSGFVIDAAAGLVLTNYHVVGAATSVNVVFADGEKVRGVVLRRDRARDVALVRVEKKNLRALPLRLGEVTLTEKVYAIGSPFGFSQTISEGIVSAFRKVEGQDMMQATAPISPGNSGGPLVDASGNVIGISTLTYRTGQNLNFFIPIGLALTTLNIKPAGR